MSVQEHEGQIVTDISRHPSANGADHPTPHSASVAPVAPATDHVTLDTTNSLTTESTTPVRGNRRGTWIVAVGFLAVVVVIIALTAAIVLQSRSTSNSATTATTALNTNEYQALFLANGQVYFGKLSNLNGKYVTLTDIYYLQVQASSSTDVQPAGKDTSSASQVSLAKLGGELHGPEDKMEVSSDQVLFWENMKDTSKVVTAIKAYQAK